MLGALGVGGGGGGLVHVGPASGVKGAIRIPWRAAMRTGL